MMVSEAPVLLKQGDYTATVSASAGGRVGRLTWNHLGQDRDLLVPWGGQPFCEHKWPKAGAFPMAPFSNRIPAAGFVFQGHRIKPFCGPEGVPVHGFLHRKAWTVHSSSGVDLKMAFHHDGKSEGWPWAFSAFQQIGVEESGMHLELSITNDSSEPMPVALGWHPYHPCAENVSTHDLVFHATGRYELDADGRACGSAGVPGFDMTSGETAAFADWEGDAFLRMGQAWGMRVRGRGWKHLVLHRPAERSYVCIEPVMVLPGRIGEKNAGIALAPGACFSAIWHCAGVPTVQTKLPGQDC